MMTLQEVIEAAKALSPDDRLRLVEAVWDEQEVQARVRPARDELLAKVLALPASDREFIVERIDDTIDRDAGFADPEVAKAWTDEVARRIEMLDKGLVKPLPADIALRQAREHLERRRAGRAAS